MPPRALTSRIAGCWERIDEQKIDSTNARCRHSDRRHLTLEIRRRMRTDADQERRKMNIAVLGIDLGKTLCSLVGLDRQGAVVLRRRMRRPSLAAFVEKQPRCIIGMEACCGAHHLARQFTSLGYDVRLMPPEYVKPYVKSHKNDDRDAEAIAEAATRPTMRFVPVKSEEQLDVQTLHRARERLVGTRTALINQLRGVLFDRGIVIAKVDQS